MDQNTGYYRIGMRMKKWWWPLFVFCLSTATHNAWALYKKSAAMENLPLDYLGFLRKTALAYVYKYRGQNPKVPRQGVLEANVVENTIRKDKGDHFLISAKTQRRCKMCKGNTTQRGTKCPDTPLHKRCFEAFHIL